MFRSVVTSAFEGFQKASVATDTDETELQLRRLRGEVRNLEGVARELMVELAALRQEVAELKTRGVAPASGFAEAPALPASPAPAPAAPATRAAAPAVAAPAPAAPAPAAAAPAPVAAAPVAAAAPAPAAPASPVIPKATPSFAALAAMAASGELEETRHADQTSTDIQGYRERMRANGRDDVQLASVGMNQAADGAKFWGPVDNESSRAKAEGQVLTIDQWECISCGTCVEQTADVFVLPDELKAEVIKQDGPMDLIQDAIDACPVTCINWIDTPEVEDFHSAGGFKEGSLNKEG